ncbi:DUF885 domain-containing protein [Novosphingobium bradum]|uniref:DUF885 domain-containing protein n=1 Tax=Novosphingobium bradum TaxID=1737444 RepID=A0ABV7ITQ2_9SPHN
MTFRGHIRLAARLAGMPRAAIALALAALALAGVPARAAMAPDPAPIAATASSTATGPGESAEDRRLMALLADDARRSEALDPIDRIYRGEHVAPEVLAEVFSASLSRRQLASTRQSLGALARIDRRRLSPERQISHDAFAWEKRTALAFLQPDLRALTEVQPINHFDGLQTAFPAIMARGGSLRFETTADYRANLALMGAIAPVLDQAIVRLREGMASGVVEPGLTVRAMIGQIDALLALGLAESPFLSPVREFPAGVPEDARAPLREAYGAAVRGQVIPAYQRLRRFLAEDYLPAARESVGLAQVPGGGALYRALVRQHTTLAVDPDSVHQLGLAEVARIQQEMAGVERELGYTVPLRAFFDVLRAEPRFHPASAADLAQGYARIARAVDAQVPRYFLNAPRTRLVIEPYPAYRARYEAGGSYNQGSADATRPGVFFYNTYDLKSRFLTGMTTLFLHEGAPGHHFQISLAQENTALPDFQRFGGNTAYVEGWALYAETLGYPMGLYADPMQHWGTLDDEMLRAMRLVVDTGIHGMGWSKDQAVDYMLANSGMGRTDAVAEVERYIAIPGQALAYKLGALTIQRLRARAEAALGPRFDIRAFHEQVLGSGALPLPVLEAKIDRWIAGQAAR